MSCVVELIVFALFLFVMMYGNGTKAVWPVWLLVLL